jgi:hypothetical protein
MIISFALGKGIFKWKQKGFHIGFVDVPTIYGSEMSKMRPVTTTIDFIKLLFS